MSTVYTKTGDNGNTSLYCGKRVEKDKEIFNILGEIDELSSRIGYLYSLTSKYEPTFNNLFETFRTSNSHYDINSQLRQIQQYLQDINSVIATESKKKRQKLTKISSDNISELEKNIDEIDSKNPPLKNFILPGKTQKDAQAHLCRTQTRKIERMLWLFFRNTDRENKEQILIYINRLSDYFFVLARFLEQ
jgi:cob(I)alamin adenosyltransferase